MQYIMADGGLTVFVKGKNKFIANDHPKLKNILDLIRNDGTEEELSDLLEYNPLQVTGTDGLVYENNSVYYIDKDGEKWELPSRLQNEVRMRNTHTLPLQPIVNFCERLFKNKSYDARKRLFSFLDNEGLPITEDGCFLAYKGVREDLYDRYTGTIHYEIGKTVRMKRELVDDNPLNPCSAGLHVGSFEYSTYGPVCLIMKIDPEHVVTVPESESTKMRCCEVTVVDRFSAKLGSFYDSHGKQLEVATPSSYIDSEFVHANIGVIKFVDDTDGRTRYIRVENVNNADNIVRGYREPADVDYDDSMLSDDQMEYFLKDKMSNVQTVS